MQLCVVYVVKEIALFQWWAWSINVTRDRMYAQASQTSRKKLEL